jgi:hypothetical protein
MSITLVDFLVYYWALLGGNLPYVVQIVFVEQPGAVRVGDHDSLPWHHEPGQAYGLGLSAASCLLGLWLYRVRRPSGRVASIA